MWGLGLTLFQPILAPLDVWDVGETALYKKESGSARVVCFFCSWNVIHDPETFWGGSSTTAARASRTSTAATAALRTGEATRDSTLPFSNLP